MPGSWSTTWQGWQCPPAPGERAASSSCRIRQGRAEPRCSSRGLQQFLFTAGFEPQKPGPGDEQDREEGAPSTRASTRFGPVGLPHGGIQPPCGTGAHPTPGHEGSHSTPPSAAQGAAEEPGKSQPALEAQKPQPREPGAPCVHQSQQGESSTLQAWKQLRWGQFLPTATLLLDGNKPRRSQQGGAAVSPQEGGAAMVPWERHEAGTGTC